MKNSFLIIILLIFLNSFSQESKDFIKSEQYYLTEIDSLTIKKYWENSPTENSPEPISIYLKNNNGQTLYEIKISEVIYEYNKDGLLEKEKMTDYKKNKKDIRKYKYQIEIIE
jgi:hypothetical protein